MTTALIDGDSIGYTIAWNLRDEADQNLVLYSVDNFVQNIMVTIEADQYIGALSSSPVFRNQIYKFAPYKGTRRPENEEIKRWRPAIMAHLYEEWKFESIPDLEADDIVSWHACTREDTIICSPDKDLRQIPGKLYNYNTGELITITPGKAQEFFDEQMVCGDTTDNIKGIPGMGEVKYLEQVKKGKTPLDMYIKYFGEYYGYIIYQETLSTVMMMSPNHPQSPFFELPLSLLQPIIYKAKNSLEDTLG